MNTNLTTNSSVPQNVVAALPERNTLKQVDDSGQILETLDRRGVWEAQTPQGFKLDLLRRAYLRARESGDSATDDSSLVEKLGHPVTVVRGEESNIKVTTESDLNIVRGLLQFDGRSEAAGC